MIYLVTFLIILALMVGRVLHGADKFTQWLCFTPALLLGASGYFFAGWLGLLGILPVLFSILFVFNGDLDYMYRVKGSKLFDVVKNYLWQIALTVVLIGAGAYFTNLWYLLLILPLLLLTGLVLWTASDNREHTGYDERKTRKNYEWSEGALGGYIAASLWLSCLNVIGGL